MIRRPTAVSAVFLITIAAALARAPLVAQSAPPVTLDGLMSYPFPDNLIASPTGSSIAWTFDERGVRNIYAADAPDFKTRRVTSYTQDDGQELTGLTFTKDASAIVYVRGGDHGSNWPAEGNLMPDPNSSPVQPKLQVWTVSAKGGAPRLVAEGDEPAISPDGERVAFVRDHRVWIAPMDAATPAQAIFAKGSGHSPVWSPEGGTLAFVSDREDHSFIAIFSGFERPLRYLAPSTSRDVEPRWSLDGREIAFVRMPGRGGAPRSPLAQEPQPWAIWVADTEAPDRKERPDLPREAWKSGTALVDSFPRIAGALTLEWAAGDRLVFTSYQDGWPHLYSIQHPGEGGKAVPLTPGAFMVENASLSADRTSIVYNANTGPDRDDIDRRHLYRVPVAGGSPIALTSGRGIEWAPVSTADGGFVAYLASDARRPAMPMVMPAAGGAGRAIAPERMPADFPSAALVTPEAVRFTSADGLEIHGQLFRTAGGAAKRPALVYVHGGPPRQMLLGWHYMGYYANDYGENQYLASRGFVVLSVNYRLGIGYGHAFHYPEHAGARGASEYQDVVAGARYLLSRPDVDGSRLGIWGGSYGGYLTALALGRNSDLFAAGVDIHGVHNWKRQGRQPLDLEAAFAGDGMSEADLKKADQVVYESSPISSVATWRSPVLLIQADDDRNVEFHQMVDLERRLLAKGVKVEELVIPDDIHDFLLWRTWRTVGAATAAYFERVFHPEKP